jgi:hypothetical protein
MSGLGRVPPNYDGNAVRFLTALKETVEAQTRAWRDLEAAVKRLAASTNKPVTGSTTTLTADAVLKLLTGRIAAEQLTADLADRIGTEVENETPVPDTVEDQEDTADTLATTVAGKQDQDDLLTAIAALVTSADQLIYTTGVDTVALATLTAAGRLLIAQANDTAQRAALGLGDSATRNVGTAAGTVAEGDHNHDTVYARLAADNTLADGVDFVFGTTTGTQLGTASIQKLGLWGVSPVIQPASANQAAVASGPAGATYTATEQAMLDELKTLVNQLRLDLIASGNIKGSA